MPTRFALAVVMLAAVACTAPDRGAPPPGIRDSAGIRIVTSSAPRASGAMAWIVDTTPSIVIADDGTPATKMAIFARIGGATRTHDGGIAVLDERAMEIRYFDSQGRFVRTAGRKGEGPGEFTYPVGLLRVAGSSLVTDETGRHSVYDDSGRLVRSVKTRGAAPFTHLENGVLVAFGGFVTEGDGEWVVEMAFSSAGFGAAPTKQPISVDSTVVTTYLPDGAKRDTVAKFPIGWSAGSQVRFSPRGLFTGAGSRFYSAFGDRAEVTAREDGRQVVTIARWPVTTAAVGQRERDESRRIGLITSKGAPYAGEELKERTADLDVRVFADSLPRFADMRSDTDGNVWLRRYQVADGLVHPWVRPTRTPEEWHVLNPDGEWLATVRTPAEVRVLEVGRDYILGIAHDDDGVESVHLYSLRRGGG